MPDPVPVSTTTKSAVRSTLSSCPLFRIVTLDPQRRFSGWNSGVDSPTWYTVFTCSAAPIPHTVLGAAAVPSFRHGMPGKLRRQFSPGLPVQA